MRTWVQEALRAPSDAIGLLWGLVTAFSIFALLRHEFSVEPLRVLMENWSLWSTQFWNFIFSVFSVKLTPRTAIVLTVTVLAIIVFFRGLIRGHIVNGWPIPTNEYGEPRLLVHCILFGVCFFIGAVVLAIAGKGLPKATPTEVYFNIIFILFALPTAIFFSFLKTPRSFFGVVIALVFLLIIDRLVIISKGI